MKPPWFRLDLASISLNSLMKTLLERELKGEILREIKDSCWKYQTSGIHTCFVSGKESQEPSLGKWRRYPTISKFFQPGWPNIAKLSYWMSYPFALFSSLSWEKQAIWTRSPKHWRISHLKSSVPQPGSCWLYHPCLPQPLSKNSLHVWKTYQSIR